jgi:hypothetical protein
MSYPHLIQPLLAPIQALMQLLEHFSGQGMIIGGVAASLLGKERTTADVDVVVLLSLDELPQLLDAAQCAGLTPRIQNVEAFARRNRVVLLHHPESGIDIDISLGALPFEQEAVARSITWSDGDLRLSLPTPEDLVILKAVAHRPKDLEDIRGILTRHPDLDWRRIEFWVRQFADALEMPELWIDLARLRPPSTHL